jgi:hypothetical protein
VKHLLLLAVAGSLAGVAACHNRSDDQAGAAPDRGDTTAVTREIDPERTGPPGTAGRPSGHEITPDSTAVDSTGAPTDTTDMRSQSTSPTSTPQDTLGPRSTSGAGVSDSMVHDSTAHDSTMTDTTTAR